MVETVKKLSAIATSQPHAAFTHCLQSQWIFLSRAMSDTSDLFQPLEETIRTVFIKALLRKDVNHLERSRLIKRQEFEFDPVDLSAQVKSSRAEVDKEADDRFKGKLNVILEVAPAELKKAVEAASEKGASSWVTAIPSYDHGTILHKGEFLDACYIRYGGSLLDLPATLCIWCSV